MMKISNLIETQAYGSWIAQQLQSRDVILLKGDLGAGKTTLARAIITALNPATGSVPSPTFTLLQTYDTSKGTVWHYDLYRLKNPEDSFELGLEEAFGTGISLIEWPERLGSLKLPPFVEINLQLTHEIGEASGRVPALNSDEEENRPREISVQGPLASRFTLPLDRYLR